MSVDRPNVHRKLCDTYELQIDPYKNSWEVRVLNTKTRATIISHPREFQLDGVIEVLRQLWNKSERID